MTKPVMTLDEVKEMYNTLCEEMKYADTTAESNRLEVMNQLFDIYYSCVTEESGVSDIIDNAMVSLMYRTKRLNDESKSYVKRCGNHYALGKYLIVEVNQMKHDVNGNPRFKIELVNVSDTELPISTVARNMRIGGYYVLQSYNLVADLERFGKDLEEYNKERFTVELDNEVLSNHGYKPVSAYIKGGN